jgi:hypothetical protein
VWWGAAAQDQLRTAREVWIVEGIFDAIALLQRGICAVAAMSSNAYPELSLKELKAARPNDLPVLVWPWTTSPGARAYTIKHARRAERLGYRCKAAQIEQTGERKTDWNDLHLRAQAAEDGDSQWQADIELAHNGALLWRAPPWTRASSCTSARRTPSFTLNTTRACTGSSSTRCATRSCAASAPGTKKAAQR